MKTSTWLITLVYYCVVLCMYTHDTYTVGSCQLPARPSGRNESARSALRRQRLGETVETQRLSRCWSFSVIMARKLWFTMTNQWDFGLHYFQIHPYNMSSCFSRLEIWQTRAWHDNCIHVCPRKSVRGENLKSSSKRRLAFFKNVRSVCEVLSEFSVTFYGWFSSAKPQQRKITFG